MSEPTIVKALTVYQPWATLIVRGAKRNETRSWKTNHRGLIMIHAASYHHAWQRDLTKSKLFMDIFRRIEGVDPEHLPLSAMVGMVNLTGWNLITHPNDLPVSHQELRLGDYRTGRYIWRLSQPLAFHEPIPAKGR